MFIFVIGFCFCLREERENMNEIVWLGGETDLGGIGGGEIMEKILKLDKHIL